MLVFLCILGFARYHQLPEQSFPLNSRLQFMVVINTFCHTPPPLLSTPPKTATVGCARGRIILKVDQRPCWIVEHRRGHVWTKVSCPHLKTNRKSGFRHIGHIRENITYRRRWLREHANRSQTQGSRQQKFIRWWWWSLRLRSPSKQSLLKMETPKNYLVIWLKRRITYALRHKSTRI